MIRLMREIGPLFVIIAALLWSIDGILRRGLYTVPPAVVVFYEHLLGATILLPFLGTWLSEVKKMRFSEWIAILVVSLFSGALGTILYTAALGKVNYIQFSVVVLLQQLQPVWAILMARLLLKEQLTRSFLLWATLALSASYLVTFKNLSVAIIPGDATLFAAFLALGAGVMWGSSTAISKYVLNKVSFLTATSLRFFFAPLFAFLFIVKNRNIPDLFILTGSQWESLLLITFSSGLVALAFYYYGLKKTKAGVTTICELVWPASALFIDYFYFKTSLSLTQWIGVGILLFAIYKITGFRKENG